MNEYLSEFKLAARLVVELLNSSNQKLLDQRTIKQKNALFNIFKGGSVEALLSEISNGAPTTFNNRWKVTYTAIQDYGNSPANAIERLGQLFGWAYIEVVWVAQVSGRSSLSIGGDDFSVLAAIQLGLPETATQLDVIRTIFTHSTLVSSLLMERFEQSVKGGLEQIIGMEGRIADWEKRLKASEELADKTEGKIGAYQKSLEKYKVAFGIQALSAAFKNFFERKSRERNVWGALALILASAIITVALAGSAIKSYLANGSLVGTELTGNDPLVAGSQAASAAHDAAALQDENRSSKSKGGKPGGIGGSVKPVEKTTEGNWSDAFVQYLPVVGLEILLIYFFRICLMQFNTTKGQLLQLEMRIAVCGFIDDYVKFSKDNEKPDLSKFESMIFSPIVSDAEKIPSTFDGVEQLEKLVAAVRGK